MMKMFQLAKINKADTENQQADKPQNTDLSAYVLSYTWSGDVEQAGRKLEFDIAYTTKDKNWTNAVLELGDEVCFSYTDEVTQEMFPIFPGAHLFPEPGQRVLLHALCGL